MARATLVLFLLRQTVPMQGTLKVGLNKMSVDHKAKVAKVKHKPAKHTPAPKKKVSRMDAFDDQGTLPKKGK
jgi:hypothetical protein